MKEENNGKQMKDVWISSTTKPSEKKSGKHPTQKPLWLMKRLILASTKENDSILDCFSGSGTTLLAANELNRKAVGIEMERSYCELTKRRFKNIEK